MGAITYADKTIGAKFTADNANEIKASVNTVYDELPNKIDSRDLSPMHTVLTTNSTEKYFFDLVFNVPHTDNMQGLTFYDGYYYIGYDVGSGNGIIRKYTLSGRLVKASGAIAIGHSAELAYRKSNGHIYAANGGGSNPTFIYEVDMSAVTPSIISTLDFSALGNSGLVAIDNDRDLLLIHTASSDTSPITFDLATFTGTILSQFTIPNQGIPQGLDCYKGRIYYYTDNKITVLDFTGSILEVIPVTKSGESEGLTIAGDYTTPNITIGYNATNRLYALRSVENHVQFHSLSPLHSVNRRFVSSGDSTPQANVSTVPKYATIALNTNSGIGNFQMVTWYNGSDFDNLISSISKSSTILTITLKQAFLSTGFFAVQGNFFLRESGYRVEMDFDGISMLVKFYNASNVVIDPNTIPAFCTIKILLMGGVSLDS